MINEQQNEFEFRKPKLLHPRITEFQVRLSGLLKVTKTTTIIELKGAKIFCKCVLKPML